MSPSRKKLSKINSRFIRHFLRLPKKALYLTIAVLTIGLSLALLSLNSLYKDHERWLAAQGNYQNLNLALASQATYANRPITLIRNLGQTNNVKEYIFGYSVPKDNLSELGLLTEPATTRPKKGFPVIILCHGYSNPQTYSTTTAYVDDMRFYSQHGFTVLKPDFRGQGLSLPDGAADGAFYSMGYNTDVMSLIAAIKKTPGLDKSQINIWGHSMGGYIALRAAVLSKDIKSAILLSAPVGNPEDLYSDYAARSDTNNDAAAEVRYNILTEFGTPNSNPKFWATVTPLSYLNRTKAFIQIYVGLKDQIVPPEFSGDLNTALNKLHKPHQYIAYPDGDHGLVSQRPQIWQNSLSALSK